MTEQKKEIEKEVIVTNIGSKGDNIILHLRFTKPLLEKPSERQLVEAMEPLPKSQMEKMGREYAKGYMGIVQEQLRASTQSLTQILPPAFPSDTIRIILSKQEYEEIGRPTVFDKLTLKLAPTLS
jgi:hypothetical protein